MKENSTSVITLLIAGISVIWAAMIALVIYIRHLHLRAEKKAEEHTVKLMEISEKHRKDIVSHKDEIVDITKKFTEVVVNVNSSIGAMDKSLEAGNRIMEKAFDDLHRSVVQFQNR